MIGYAKQKSNSVDVYDEHGKFLFNKCGQVVGYTSASVSIKSNTGTVGRIITKVAVYLESKK